MMIRWHRDGGGSEPVDPHVKEAKRNMWGRITSAALVFVAVLSVVIALFTLLYRQQQTHEQQQKQNQILQILVDCTQPGHDCYDTNQRRTAGLIRDLERVAIAANFCANLAGNDTNAKVSACVKRQMTP